MLYNYLHWMTLRMNMLANYEDEIYQSIDEYLITINIQKELDEDFLESGNENIYWSIADVSVEKENKNIVYYVNLDISVLADLVYQEDNDYLCDAGRIALALIGQIEISMEEYSTINEIKALSVEKSDILHIEPEIWTIVKNMENKNSCKEIITTSKNIIKIQEGAKKLNQNIDINGLKEALQQSAILCESLTESIKPMQVNNIMTESVRQLSANLKAMEAATKPMQVNNTIIEFSKQLAPTLKALESVKTLQVSGAMENIAKNLSLLSKAINMSNPTDDTM